MLCESILISQTWTWPRIFPPPGGRWRQWLSSRWGCPCRSPRGGWGWGLSGKRGWRHESWTWCMYLATFYSTQLTARRRGLFIDQTKKVVSKFILCFWRNTHNVAKQYAINGLIIQDFWIHNHTLYNPNNQQANNLSLGTYHHNRKIQARSIPFNSIYNFT